MQRDVRYRALPAGSRSEAEGSGGPPAAGLARMSGRRKCAVALTALGVEGATEVLRLMSPSEVDEITTALVEVGTVTVTERDVVMAAVERSLSARGPVEGARFARQALEQALGSDEATAIMNRVACPTLPRFDVLAQQEPVDIARLLAEQGDQVAAVVLAHLPPNLAGVVLAELPAGHRPAVIERLVDLRSVPDHVLDQVEASITTALDVLPGARGDGVDGFALVAEMIARSGRQVETVLIEDLEKLDPELAARVRDSMFMFDDVMKLGDRDLQTMLRDVDKKDLTLALRGVKPAFRDRIFENISARLRESIEEDLDALGPQPRKDVEAARATIVHLTRELADQGKINIFYAADEAEELI